MCKIKTMASTNKSYANRYLQILRTVSDIILSKRPQKLIPFYWLLKLVKTYCAGMEPNFRLLPIPKRFYEFVIKNEFFKSDHYLAVSDDVFHKFVGCKDLNWVNLNFGNGQRSASFEMENDAQIVSTILNKPKCSVLVPVVQIVSKQCQPNCVFVSENCFQNFVAKYRLKDEPIYVSIGELQNAQSICQLATRATIFIINNPHDISNDVIDEILGCYFQSPRILYRNHTYEIIVDDTLLGTAVYAKYFHIFSNLKKIFFRCVHLESKDNPFEIMAVVVKGLTSVHQTTSINYIVPKQTLHDLCIIDTCPNGLRKYFNNLQSSIRPFIDTTGNKADSLSSQNVFPVFLVHGDRGSGKNTVVTAVVQTFGIQTFGVDCADVVSQIPAQTEAKLKLVLSKANVCEPLVICLHNFEIFGVDNEGHEDLRLITAFQNELHNLFAKERQFPVILIAISSTNEPKPIIQRLFLETIKFIPPEQNERYEILKWLHLKESTAEQIFEQKIENIPLCDVNQSDKYFKRFINDDLQNTLHTVANKTQGFLYGDLILLYQNTVRQSKLQQSTSLTMQHFEINLARMQADFSDSLGYSPKVPKVLWSDIGGLAKLKDEIQSSIGLPLKHMHLMGKNMRRSGILLYGPPGTGKTLVAKAVATECNLSFLSVQGPELLNMYVGQSEQNVREVFARARSAAPCVVFLDELDSLAPNRGMAGDSGGVMDRVVSQLLAEMDGMTTDDEPQKQIFILAATNRPDLIDPALLRPGRFDKLLFVGPCTTPDDKIAVLTAQLKRFTLAEQLTIKSIAELLKQDMTGADLYSICSNAWLSAVRRVITQHKTDKSNQPTLMPENIVVNIDDFKQAATNFIPSISKTDLEYFNKLKSNFSPTN
ncbi:peroxisome assembly factor 2 isoform X3 [Bradysia coprophila]|uniref:peroxisome assembly factor 2 isoform X3 n=2 Tax=Bradysia coprophila TaxID=38358 RepID=UPI00187DCCFD|nr:peroxisome assembly factor 2 isoform X3 [Bradysia coprophila]